MLNHGMSRLAAAEHRRVLRTVSDRFVRASIYLELGRLYRVLGRMKNAHLELKRSFAELGLSWPRNSWAATLVAYFRAGSIPTLHPDFNKQSQKVRTEFYAELYEEVGLSAYYLQQRHVLVRAIIETRVPCKMIGNSPALLNWYGGGAAVLVLMGLRKKGRALLEKCADVAAALDTPKYYAKHILWRALAEDYQGQPVRSAALFESCMEKYRDELELSDLRMATITLSLNYLSRGHPEKALHALNYFPTVGGDKDDWSLGSSSWYRLGPEAMLGQTDRLAKARSIFQSILTVDNDEKWRLAQFLGQLLIVERVKGAQQEKVTDLFNRFKVLHMTPHATHLETCFFWVALCYARMELAISSPAWVDDFKKSISDVRQLPNHPTNLAHYSFFQAALAKMQGRTGASRRWMEKSRVLAEGNGNLWVLNEIERSLPRC